MERQPEENKQELEALTITLKRALMIMMIKKWNGKDFKKMEDLSGMADDIIEIVATLGKGMKNEK